MICKDSLNIVFAILYVMVFNIYFRLKGLTFEKC